MALMKIKEAILVPEVIALFHFLRNKFGREVFSL